MKKETRISDRITIPLTTWSRVILEAYSHSPGPYPESYESRPHLFTIFL